MEQILQSKKQGKDTSEFETQIDSAVYALYALTPTEITLIERK